MEGYWKKVFWERFTNFVNDFELFGIGWASVIGLLRSTSTESSVYKKKKPFQIRLHLQRTLY